MTVTRQKTSLLVGLKKTIVLGKAVSTEIRWLAAALAREGFAGLEMPLLLRLATL
jgi:hypothetical protein